MQRDCPNSIKCSDCGKTNHPTALHIKSRPDSDQQQSPMHGGEPTNQSELQHHSISSRCTQICFNKFGSKSCAKIVLVKAYCSDNPSQKMQLYAMLDDQSNRTLGKSQLFDYFGATGTSDYVLSTCSGKTHSSGRKLNNLIVESLDGDTKIELSDILECDQIPDTPDEIPTREVAIYHAHLNELINLIPPLDSDAKILLLIGRDTIQAHHVQDQIIGPNDGPYAQKLPLGWTIIGETCLGKLHRPDRACVKKTYFHTVDRLSIFPPCTSEIKIEEMSDLETNSELDQIGSNIFIQTKDDNKPGLSRDDREFLEIMEREFQKDTDGNWSAPLPFRNNRPKLPNNKVQAYKRAKSLDISLRKNQEKRGHFISFMRGILERGHAEIAPDIDEGDEQWYLPIFGVYHPKKPEKLRAVFDSSAKFDGLSLNDVLLSGPDLANSLLGVLLRFRREPVAVMGDIEQMFYCFKVHESDRNYLRFLWYTDNNFDKPLTVYRMTVHVFGNSPSPAIATYGLRKTAKEGESEFGSDMTNFVTHDFYVDDGLTAQPTATEAIDLMKRTQSALKTIGKLRLHKISSNVEEVMNTFETDDLAKELMDLNFDSDSLPTQRSLGINWDLKSDCFMYKIEQDIKPYTRRGVLSTINSIYDPLGFLAPVTIRGKLLLRSVMRGSIEWDEPLPPNCYDEWESWRTSLFDLETLKIPRMFASTSFRSADRRIIHIYSDASEKAVAAVGYLQLEFKDNTPDPRFGFVIGKAKVAPSHAQTIPRLELCGALLATEIGQIISDNLNIPLYDIRYYTDSRVVLGYIYNSSRRFYTYVSNRIAKIHQVSEPSYWSYIHTERNPADIATRSITADKLQDSVWLLGPSVDTKSVDQSKDIFPLQEPEMDGEIRPEIVNKKTLSDFKSALGSHRFERFGNWKSLVRSIAFLKNKLKNKKSEKKVDMKCSFREAEQVVIRTVQREFYEDEFQCLENKRPLRKDSTLLQLNPIIDENGIMRVGGRINQANISSNERNPIILTSKHWVATLIVRFYHDKTQHQGRHFTSGAVRTNGYWIVGGKRLVSSILHKCVTCRKLRRSTEHQKMADLPKDRLQPDPPFTSVGIDTFGPWSVVTRRTRGGAANSKRWAIIFTCMSTRGVHIEVVEEMSTSSFINAFKRFVSIRGDVKLIRSDRGTNFVGATDHLGINRINVEDGPIKNYLHDNGIEWHFNSPHSSHMGGIWERMIRTTRSILNSMIAKLPGRELSHEVLVTLLAEVSAIINSRPLTCISYDAEEPFPLTPSLLITQKPNVLIPKNVSFDCKDMYRSQWKHVQYLAETFWHRWRKEYLQSLQTRRKWIDRQNNIAEGDVVLLKDNQAHRINWPIGLVTKIFPSTDNLVRKVELRIVRTGDKNSLKVSNFVRPISELVLLVSDK